MTKQAFNYLIISDLHLQEAEKNPAGRLFYFDHEFAEFLRHYRLFYIGERRWKLIIAGDFIEFLHVKDRPEPDDKLLQGLRLSRTDVKFSPGTEPPKSLWKLNHILSSHPQLLLALARFVAAGNEIYILRGNHDQELFWPEVQNHFRLLVAQHHPVDKSYLDMKTLAQTRIHFVPWFYLEHGLLYVEHGHQYDPYCSNAHNLYPIVPDNPQQLELALSAFTIRYFASRIQNIDPAAIENINSIPKYLLHLIRNNPGQVALMPAYYLEMVVRTLGKVRREDKARESFLDQMEAKIREEIKAEHGLTDETLHAIAELSHSPLLRSRWETIKCFSIDLLVAGTVALIAGVSLSPAHWGTFHGVEVIPVLTGVVFFALALLWKKRMGRFNDHRNLQEIARAISRILGCRYVILGHSHDPDAHALSEADGSWYFNVGTWIPRGAEGQFIYLEILKEAAETSAHLMRWNRKLQQPEELDPTKYAKRNLQREGAPA